MKVWRFDRLRFVCVAWYACPNVTAPFELIDHLQDLLIDPPRCVLKCVQRVIDDWHIRHADDIGRSAPLGDGKFIFQGEPVANPPRRRLEPKMDSNLLAPAETIRPMCCFSAYQKHESNFWT
jgi:hypothetical protein